VLDHIRLEHAPWRRPREVQVQPRLRAEIKFFGRHKGGSLRVGVLRGVTVME
jgi:hypothetical protein